MSKLRQYLDKMTIFGKNQKNFFEENFLFNQKIQFLRGSFVFKRKFSNFYIF
jgi:hypothetical protein